MIRARISKIGAPNYSPKVQLDSVTIPQGVVHIVRDDLLPGGTKQRAIVPYLRRRFEGGKNSFVYASPFCGFAQVALAYSSQALGYKSVLFAEAAPESTPGNLLPHEFTALAESYGATVYLYSTLDEAEAQAEIYATQFKNVYRIPLGFSSTEYKQLLSLALRIQWHVIEKQLGGRAKRLWLPVGSGTLASVFRNFLPEDVELCCVDVHVLEASDLRIAAVKELPNTSYHSAPELFREKFQWAPPIPSNHHYDAKLWRFMLDRAKDGDVWWNVAR